VIADGGVLTPDAILDAAEDVLRRYGPGKATVVDVAKALRVSHGSVYRHFTSKVALRDAVAERWLARVSGPLELIAAEHGPALPRLRRWLDQLAGTKQRMAREDPELFATFHQITTESREVVAAHVQTLAAQVAAIVADGVARGEFDAVDPVVTGRAFLHATTTFHHPAHAAEWSDPALDANMRAVRSLLESGLIPRTSTPGTNTRQTDQSV
jgi:AcrR family transcriptional regulator